LREKGQAVLSFAPPIVEPGRLYDGYARETYDGVHYDLDVGSIALPIRVQIAMGVHWWTIQDPIYDEL